MYVEQSAPYSEIPVLNKHGNKDTGFNSWYISFSKHHECGHCLHIILAVNGTVICIDGNGNN